MGLRSRVVLLVLAAVAGFVYIGNAIPQVKSGPAEKGGEIGGSPEELAAQGKKIFTSDRAGCLVCHTVRASGGRCPDLEGVGERATARGGAAYLVDSLYDPNAFVVPGYPRNQMTPVNRPPIALSHDEILAAIAYLNTLGGKSDEEFVRKVKGTQKPWRDGTRKPAQNVEEAKLPILAGDPARGHEIFKKQRCIQCHRVGSQEPEEKDSAPDLTSIGSSQSAEYALESILNPNAVVVKGYSFIHVYFKDDGEDAIEEARALEMEWLPDREKPEKLRVHVRHKKGKVEAREIDLSTVASVGNCKAAVLTTANGEEDYVDVAGEYLSGDAKTGIAMKVLEGGRWVEKRFPPEKIKPRSLLLPSPMRSDFGDEMTPREIYDLVSYLMKQKGRKE